MRGAKIEQLVVNALDMRPEGACIRHEPVDVDPAQRRLRCRGGSLEVRSHLFEQTEQCAIDHRDFVPTRTRDPDTDEPGRERREGRIAAAGAWSGRGVDGGDWGASSRA